jgi:hypothetical protein
MPKGGIHTVTPRQRAAAILVLILFSGPNLVWACSCVDRPSATTGFQESAAVFTGNVTEITDKGGRTGAVRLGILDRIRSWFGLPFDEDKYYGNKVSFKVNRSWKGVATTETEVHTGYGGGDCGVRFIVGAEYLVYAYAWNDRLETSVCGRTGNHLRLAEDLSVLSTVPELSLSSGIASQTRYAILISALCGAAVFIVFLELRRRRQGK